MRTGWGVSAMVAIAMTAASAQAQTPGQMPAPAQTAMQDSAPHHVVTIVETGAPDAAKVAAMLQILAVGSRKETGNAGYAVLQERGHPGRFAILETWRDKAALDRHETAAKTDRGQDAAAARRPLGPARLRRARCRRYAGGPAIRRAFMS